MKQAYLTIRFGESKVGRLDLVLYDEVVPRTVSNFCHYLSQQKPGEGYKNSIFHRIIKGFMAQGGDFIRGDGTGSTSIYGKTFDDENFIHGHDRPGTLSMANSGRNTNGSQFFLTFRPTPHLDGKHVVFGRVDLTSEESRSVLNALERVRTGPNDRPFSPVEIVDCGTVDEEIENSKQPVGEMNSSKESTSEHMKEQSKEDVSPNPAADENELELPDEEDEEEEPPPKTKAEALRQRMRKLKMKMNQARQLNKQEVLREGERLGSVEGASKAKKRQMLQDKKSQQIEWQTRNSKALQVAAEHGIDGKHLVEQADESLKKAYKKEEKAYGRQFELNDYYNPEGQHRSYTRNLKSLPRAAGQLRQSDELTATFNPISNVSDEAREREGARNLALEMKRINEKKEKKKRNRKEFEQNDVSYINQRNKRFNQKISRNFDKHTAEIRQNLERGTAL